MYGQNHGPCRIGVQWDPCPWIVDVCLLAVISYGLPLCLCGEKRYTVLVRDSGDFNGLSKQEGVVATTGTLMLLTMTFKG